MQTRIQKWFRPLKAFLPGWLSRPIRNVVTAFLTPMLWTWRNGHFRSCFGMVAVSRFGQPIPWYTYPCIEFLKQRDYTGKVVLEFGAGQSTLWWAERAGRVVAFEGDGEWMKRLRARVPANVELYPADSRGARECIASIRETLAQEPGRRFDVVVIDGLWRGNLVEVASEVLKDGGIIVCDDANGYGFYERFLNRGFGRIDFVGNAPCVVLPRCTSVYFDKDSFVFAPEVPIPSGL